VDDNKRGQALLTVEHVHLPSLPRVFCKLSCSSTLSGGPPLNPNSSYPHKSTPATFPVLRGCLQYIQVGKGRDMGFDTINSFESKVGGGNGEQVLSRDVHRLGARFDFFRLLAFYESGKCSLLAPSCQHLPMHSSEFSEVFSAIPSAPT
jgi:hypothetical protein